MKWERRKRGRRVNKEEGGGRSVGGQKEKGQDGREGGGKEGRRQGVEGDRRRREGKG